VLERIGESDMPRTVKEVIEDLIKESRFMGRCGMVTTANLMQEAVYYLKMKEENKDGDKLGTDRR
jgi:hypothetical protein